MQPFLLRPFPDQLQSLRHFFLCAVAFTIPFPFAIALNSILNIGFAACTLVLFALYPHPRWHWSFLLPAAFVLFTIVYVPFSSAPVPAWHLAERKLLLGALPLLAMLAPLSRQTLLDALFYFISAILLVAFAALVLAIGLHARSGESFVFLGTSILYPFGLHRVFISFMALLACLAILGCDKAFLGKARWPVFASLLVWHIWLSSRTGLITVCVLVIAYGLWQIISRRRYWLSAGLGLALCVIGLLVWQVPYIHNMLLDIDPRRNIPSSASVDSNDGLATRLYIWKAAISCISRAPLLGHGRIEAQEHLNQEYQKQGFSLGVQYQYNCHNQYLQTWLEHGILGLILLLSIVFTPAFLARKRRQPFGYFLSIAFFIPLCTEIILEVQKGATTFALALVLFLSLSYLGKDQEAASL